MTHSSLTLSASVSASGILFQSPLSNIGRLACLPGLIKRCIWKPAEYRDPGIGVAQYRNTGIGKALRYCNPWSETCRYIFSTDYDCFRLAQSYQTVFHRGGNKPEVFQDGFLCGGRVFLMDDDCLRAISWWIMTVLGYSHRFPPWQQQTGSSFPRGFSVWRTCCLVITDQCIISICIETPGAVTLLTFLQTGIVSSSYW